MNFIGAGWVSPTLANKHCVHKNLLWKLTNFPCLATSHLLIQILTRFPHYTNFSSSDSNLIWGPNDYLQWRGTNIIPAHQTSTIYREHLSLLKLPPLLLTTEECAVHVSVALWTFWHFFLLYLMSLIPEVNYTRQIHMLKHCGMSLQNMCIHQSFLICSTM